MTRYPLDTDDVLDINWPPFFCFSPLLSSPPLPPGQSEISYHKDRYMRGLNLGQADLLNEGPIYYGPLEEGKVLFRPQGISDRVIIRHIIGFPLLSCCSRAKF